MNIKPEHLPLYPFYKSKIDPDEPSLWRYQSSIPVLPETAKVSLQEGFTPMRTVTLSGKTLWIKQEQLSITGSYKDRGASVLISKARELGIREVVQDSSGNAGCSIAAYAAAAGMTCTLFVQKDTSPSKLAQMEAYGARLKLIDGTREDVAEAALIAAKHTYYASHVYNPYFLQGTKTVAFEIAEQRNWNIPEAVVLPAGNGTLLLGCYIGFQELLASGIITRIPKLIAIQAAHCSPLVQAFLNQDVMLSDLQTKATLAEGIAIAKPARATEMLEAVRNTQGTFISVSEQEIVDAWKACAQSGYYIEPTSAATIAGALSYAASSPQSDIVTLFSGHGLKSTEKNLKHLHV